MADEPTYLDAIPEQYRDVPSIRDAGSMENLMQQHVNLESKMGTAVFAPGEGADDEQWNGFYQKVHDLAPGLTRIPTDEDGDWNALYAKLGRPEEPTGYETPTINIDDNNALDQSDYEEAFRTVSHELGLSGKQYKGLMQWIGDRTVQKMSDASQARTDAIAALRNEWGDGTDARIDRAIKVITDFGGEDAANAMGDLGNNPIVLKMIDSMAESLGESAALPGSGARILETKTEIEDEIATLRGNAAYTDRKHPDHKRVVEKVNKLYEKLESYKAA